MPDFDKIFADTETHVQSLEKSFLEKHIKNATASPQDYDLDVKSYCILCHAAFEEFAETIALSLMDTAIKSYINAKKITETLVSLMHFKASGEAFLSKLKNDDSLEVETAYDYVRSNLSEVKKRFSGDITNNHGVSLKYLRQLLIPVAIDIPKDAILTSSLQKLANERGHYAHKLLEEGTVKRSLAPEDAKKTVEDCIKLFSIIRDRAKAKI